MHPEQGYLELIRKIFKEGFVKEGRNGKTLSIFGEKIDFDLSKGFPLLTTKRVFWRGIVEELLWFLRGSTNANELKDKNIHIWDGNTSREFLDSVGLTDVAEGEIGAGYGYQWRCFGGDYPTRENGIDQLKYLLTELTENPNGRRALLCAWNPKQLSRMALPPCHFSYLFNVNNDELSCMMQMRSCDVGSGLPFNIASTALFTSILAHVLHMKAKRIVITMGDTHLYESHMESGNEQISREPYPFPELQIIKEAPSKDASVDEKLRWIEELQATDIQLNNYKHHSPLLYPMVV